MPFNENTRHAPDEPDLPPEDIVEPPPAAAAAEPDTLPPETAIAEYAQTEQPTGQAKSPIAIVDVKPESEVHIEAAADKIADEIQQDADRIRATLRNESAARQADATRKEKDARSPHVVTEMSKTIPEIAAHVARFAMRAFKSATTAATEKIEARLSGALAAPGVSSAERADAQRVDTQERADAIAAWVGEGGATRSPGDPGENINLSDEPNPFVEGHPKPGESEFSGMAETAALEREKREPSLQPDDLMVIEGIGPKIDAALKAAGIDTFARLATASDGELRAAIQAAGMRLAPSLSTWAQQAAYAAVGDWDGLKGLQQTMAGGRKPSRSETES